MVYTSQPSIQVDTKHRLNSEVGDLTVSRPDKTPAFLDPALLQTARQIYRRYYEVHYNQTQRPLGVVIHQITHRGQLIFKQKPILLPQESFIPLSQIEL